ncbi:MAG TPA: quinone-dependent dihydroorotate dehydrogenase [Marinospirillum sp.]|uniref:quinone-dependent dihydroorotate dehydrogenase n=1 Tax=Marinospirillum sp. TaxID=2183934 RepID=UPI002B45B1C1|nr:quinone-dependent dihydroorotate dehydrogenase [Marinospirillum sp.]HKM15598.1 quinone-dependent dihydroorotate dehydrogenase [Marinospirillum sp.]
MYSLARKLLFTLSGEAAHQIALEGLDAAARLRLLKPFVAATLQAPVNVMGLEFPNAVGLAAGLDKNADHLYSLDQLGFGFIEVGTVTPRPQPGNPKPRMFRIPEQEAIINRMGFNNKGLDYLLAQVKKQSISGVLGINLGKNLTTPVEKAVNDYLLGLEGVYEYADYVTVNISSPNTPGLRNLQYGEALKGLLLPLKEAQARLADQHQRYVPLAVKVAPDMNEEELQSLAATLRELKLDAVIATNTTLDKTAVNDLRYGAEAGGLSGRPLTEKACEITRQLANALEGDLPIIGVGGIFSAQDAVDRIEAGASLIQLYTGFIYRGPSLISECAEAIASIKPA